MQEMNNSVETSDLLETFDGMELIEATLLDNVSGGNPMFRCRIQNED
jgi:hypothetical protein